MAVALDVKLLRPLQDVDTDLPEEEEEEEEVRSPEEAGVNRVSVCRTS